MGLVGTAVVGLVAVGTFLLVRGALVDDAYITLAYARNLAFDGHWGLLSEVSSNTATAPGWVLVLGAVTAVVRRPVLALGLLHVLMAVGLERCLSAVAVRSGLPRWVGPVAALAVGTNPLLLSSVGLETSFLLLLLAALLLTARAGRPLLFGLLAGAVVLTRMDAGVVVAFLALGVPAMTRRLFVAVPAALVVVVPWMTWSWFHLGSAVPDTVIIKTAAQRWDVWDVSNGWRWYAELYGADAVVSFLPAAAGVVGLVALVATRVRSAQRTGPHLAFGLGGLAHWGALSWLVVPPFHWYYGVLVGTGTVVAVAGAGALLARGARAWTVAGGLAGLACIGQVLVAGGLDVRHGTPWTLSAVQTNYATPAQYAAIGRDLDARYGPGSHVTSPGEIGHLAFACDCVVDIFADPARLWPLVVERRAESPPWLQTVIDANYTRFPRDAREVTVDGRLFWVPDAAHGGPDLPVPGQLADWPAVTGHILQPGRIVLLQGAS